MTKSSLVAGPTLALLGRFVLGGLFIYMGLSKVLHPVEFLKLLRQYEIMQQPILLNVIAGGLPWFEVFTGLLLVMGIAVRGAGLLSVGMLIPFTLAIAQRAAAIHQAQGTAFCGIRFDCGCGNGEVLICRKLVENIILIALACLVVAVRAPRASLYYGLFERRSSTLV
jgi:uncharacterized membrane protein YphA (DoxX/SURF4 family)